MREFQTLKSNLIKTRIVDTNSNVDELNQEEITVDIERFAFTANNVTYGVAGETIGYWKFFPPSNDPRDEWGCIPMWGFAQVVNSKNGSLKISAG